MSNRSRVYRTHAVVLRRRDYSDADRILTIFTPRHGKLELIAKGARKTKSRKAGHLETFAHSSLLVAKGRTWDIITEAETVESFRHLRDDLEGISYASYFGELVAQFTEADDENLPLWELLLSVLRELDARTQHAPEAPAKAPTGSSPDPATPDAAIHNDIIHNAALQNAVAEAKLRLLARWFELHLLNLTGFQPQLFSCIGCGQPLEPVVNFFSIEEGGVFCPICAEAQHEVGTRAEAIEPDVLKVLRFLQSRELSDMRRLTVRPEILRRIETLLYRYLLVVLERQLKSIHFLRRLQNEQAPA